jgi:carboxymethylenebutenolidase
VVGYCWGALLAWRAACELGYLSAAVCHYGGGMEAPEDRERQPLCPTLVHFPTDARWMAPQGIQAFATFQAAHSPAAAGRGTEVHVHPGRYGFMQPQHTGHDESLARQVQARTLAYLQRALQDDPTED